MLCAIRGRRDRRDVDRAGGSWLTQPGPPATDLVGPRQWIWPPRVRAPRLSGCPPASGYLGVSSTGLWWKLARDNRWQTPRPALAVRTCQPDPPMPLPPRVRHRGSWLHLQTKAALDAMPGRFCPTTRDSSKTIGQCRRVPERAYREGWLGNQPGSPRCLSPRSIGGVGLNLDRPVRPDAGAVLLCADAVEVSHGLRWPGRLRSLKPARLTRPARLRGAGRVA